jgi:signal transduction histidine kinase
MDSVTKRRSLSVLAWSTCALTVALVVATLAFAWVGSFSVDGPGVVWLLSLIAFGLVGGLIAGRRPQNPIGWIFCAGGLSLSLSSFATRWSEYALHHHRGPFPLGHAMTWLATWSWTPGILLMFTFLLLLFPDGHLPSRRWRPVAWLAGAVIVGGTIPYAITAWPLSDRLLSNIGDSAPAAAPTSFKITYNVQVACILIGFALGLVCALSLILRIRRASGDQREQLKWFAFAAAILVVAVIASSPLLHAPSIVATLSFPLLPIASAVAILKFRLYDIDVVINKTVVFTALVAFATAVYLAIVVGIGSLIGRTNNVVLSILATAIVAVAFQPLRVRARRLANRLVYGKRATPYEVLSEFSGRVGGSFATDDVLPRAAQLLGQGTGATRAEVWLRVGDELSLAAVWPEAEGADRTLALIRGELPAMEDASLSAPVRHRGELLGALTVTKPANEPLTPAERGLVTDLASQAGLVLRNVALIAELRASRQRLVRAQDEERRRLERNLHDGAQQQLVALSVKVRLAQTLVGREDDRARDMLGEVQSDSQAALEDLRDLARGIYPPVLADRGLAAALEAQSRRSAVPVSIDSNGTGRYAQDVESAVYFCVLEAINNVAKYAEASRVAVHLSERDGNLRFEVADDGRGFDSSASTGTGLRGMADRMDAIGGRLRVSSEPGHGTTVVGEVPLADRPNGASP